MILHFWLKSHSLFAQLVDLFFKQTVNITLTIACALMFLTGISTTKKGNNPLGITTKQNQWDKVLFLESINF